MPSLHFVLPHWLYWSELIFFPLIATYLVRRQRQRADAGRANHFLAYLFLVTAGFVGMHRFYLRNVWGLIFIPVFLAVLWTNAHVRVEREHVSLTRSVSERSERLLKRAQEAADKQQPDAAAKLAKARSDADGASQAFAASRAALTAADNYNRIAAIVLGLMLLGDALLIPGLVRRTRAAEQQAPPLAAHPMETAVPEPQTILPAPTGFLGAIDWLVARVGELVAYWAVIAVFTYYYEVIARYMFNSPTNWVHESMFLMFGMQYMLAGAYAYRDETHVRVDILYSKLPRRGRAVCDVITSAFFFLFIGTMLVTGWRFASDAISVREVSFTEWGVQYWPVKLMIPVGAALLILQGFSRLLRDIAIVVRRAG